VVILGRPNAGKSSLLNCLLKDDRAIVSDQAGTTRDVVEARLELEGMPVTLVDTAGLRDQYTDEIEIEGMRRTRNEAMHADLAIILIDGSEPGNAEMNKAFINENVSRETQSLVVYNKSDINNVSRETLAALPGMSISTQSGSGISDLTDRISELITASSVSGVGLTRVRHESAVRHAVEHLAMGRGRIEDAAELAAEDVRMAVRSLGTITGAVDVEDILGEIFSSFCIGK